MTIIYPLFGNCSLSDNITEKLSAQTGQFCLRQFPDSETYFRVEDNIINQSIVLYADLFQPNEKIIPLIFAVNALREAGVKKVGAVIPYLPYMRQDIAFKTGECISAKVFAQLLSNHLDWLVTVDPHLHRFTSLTEIYSIPTQTVHATGAIASWLSKQVTNPILLGPDSESKQWVEDIATQLNAPFATMSKSRSGDREVDIVCHADINLEQHTPVLVDDIISTGQTMLKAIQTLPNESHPICIGVHALMSSSVITMLQEAGMLQFLTCNSIPHPTNTIDLSDLIVDAVNHFI